MTVYVVRSFSGFEPHNFECFTSERVNIEDGHTELAQPLDHLKDQGKEFIKVKLADEGKKPNQYLEHEPISQANASVPQSLEGIKSHIFLKICRDA